MARKKQDELDQKIETALQETEPKKELIALINLDFGRTDLNVLVDKINEIITKLNEHGS